MLLNYIVISFCAKNNIFLELTPNSSSSNLSFKNMAKDKEANTGSNTKTESYIRKTPTINHKEPKDNDQSQSQNFHNSIGFRKGKDKKATIKSYNNILNSNKKNENKKLNINNNAKLLYEKLKKKTFSNNKKNYDNNDPKISKFAKTFKKRESLPQYQNKFNKFNNTTRKRKYTVKNNNNLDIKYNNIERKAERRYSTNNAHRPILSLDDIAASFNKIKEKRNNIIIKFKKDNISQKEQAFYILSTSPVLRLCEQYIFSNSTNNIKKVLKYENLLNNHNIFLNAKANELQNEISLCEKRISTPFVASKIADITLNFITSMDEQEFKSYDILENNKDELDTYYNYIKLLLILFNENYEDKISGSNLKLKLFETIKSKGFDYIRDCLYHIYIDKKEENTVVSKIDMINNDIIKSTPNILNFHKSLKICRFVAFSNYLIKEIINYANNIKDMIELKYRAKNLLDIVYDKIDLIEKNNKEFEKSIK